MMILAMCQIWCKKKYDSSTKLGFDYDKMVKEEATGFEISRIAKLLKGKTFEISRIAKLLQGKTEEPK